VVGKQAASGTDVASQQDSRDRTTLVMTDRSNVQRVGSGMAGQGGIGQMLATSQKISVGY
jgi:hypothetical protein